MYSTFIKLVFVWISFQYENNQACWLPPQLSRGEKVSWSPGGSNLPECWGKMLWVGKWELEINLSNFTVWPRPRQVLCIPYMIVCADVWLSKHPWPLGLCTEYTGGGWLPVFKVHYKNTGHKWKLWKLCRCLQTRCPSSVPEFWPV